MRIAIVTETFLPKVDGVVRSLVEFLRYLRRKEHDAIVFCPGDGPPTAEGFPVIRCGGTRFPLYPELRLAPWCPMLAPRLRSWRPDVVHLAGPALLGVNGLSAARRCGIPVAAHFQTDLPAYARHYGLAWFAPLLSAYLTAVHNRCAVTYAPTRAVVTTLCRRGIHNVHVCGRGVDVVAFDPAYRSETLRARWGAEPGDVVLLAVGRLSPEKNLRRLADLVGTVPKSKLVIVGDGPYRPELERVLGGAAHFTGQLAGEALASAYASADVFLFPSLTDTFGQVMQEAMASGLPVVAMHVNGSAEIVEDGHTGLLCAPSAPSAWLDNVRLLARAPEIRRAIGGHGRAVALTRSWDAIFDRLLIDYRALTQQHHLTVPPQSVWHGPLDALSVQGR